MSALEGRAWTFGDHVDTDVIIPAKHLNTFDPAELAPHCFEGVDPAIAQNFRRGDIIVGGENFGCGSSREHAPLAMLGLGAACVLARSYGQIFYRNAFNQGLPLLEADIEAGAANTGDALSVDIVSGRIENKTSGQTFQAAPIPPFMQEIIDAGGLIPHVLKGR